MIGTLGAYLASFEGGMEVRLVDDPGRRGTLTGKQRERAGVIMYQVRFSDGTSYQADYAIEPLSGVDDDVYTLIAESRYGRLTDLRRNLSHIQLSGRLANLVYSMETTNTEFYAYQFKPVLSFLESPSKGLLIADEVGLGKTIEAGLIWTELRARYESRRLVVVCPAMLREKWRDELKVRFGVDAQICNAAELLDVLKRPRHLDDDGKGYICSLQGLRPPRGWREDEIENESPRRRLAQFLESNMDEASLIDLVVFDEAHYLRNPESQTARLGLLLRDVSEHVVLLSATPVNLREDDLFYLLNIVDPDSFDVREVFPLVLQANEPLQKARAAVLDQQKGFSEVRKLLEEAQEHPILKESSQLESLVQSEVDLSGPEGRAKRIRLANRIERVNLLSHAVSRTRKSEVTEWRVTREPFSEFVPMTDVERDFYDRVTEAVSRYAFDADISDGFLLASPQRQISSSMAAAAAAWAWQATEDTEELYEDIGVDIESNKHAAPLVSHLRDTVMQEINVSLLEAADSKYERFSKLIREFLEKSPDEKVVVFSYFRGTLTYLSRRLEADGVGNIVLMGGMKKTKQDVIDDFRNDTAASVLLSSEVASEGVDLQFSKLLVNYDLPWNPMKVEQRIGRIDRIGQKAPKINIWNLCYEDTIDHRIHERLFIRLGIFERALGGMEAILGEEIKHLTHDLICRNLTPAQQDARIEQTAMAIARTRHDQDELESQASHLIAHGGYILDQVRAAHEFKRRITEVDLQAYVKDYFEKFCPGHVLQQIDADVPVFDIRMPAKAASALEEFMRQRKLLGKSRLATTETIRCRFTSKILSAERDVEPISQFHPLIRFISHDLKIRNEGFYPLIAAQVAHGAAPGVEQGLFAFAIELWSFSGVRTDEELHARATSLRTGDILDPDIAWDLINAARLQGDDWLAAQNVVDSKIIEGCVDDCVVQMEQDYRDAAAERKNENADRVSFQKESASRHRNRQIEMHTRVLNDLIDHGKQKLVPARRGLIKKVEERFEQQIALLGAKSEFTHSRFDVCFGVVKVG